jgi:hypothetical protein
LLWIRWEHIGHSEVTKTGAEATRRYIQFVLDYRIRMDQTCPMALTA